jgi:hypothetical protein
MRAIRLPICRRWPAIVFERGCEIKELSPKR